MNFDKLKVVPRTGDTLASLANALDAVAEAMTIACEMHGGEWEGGRLNSPYKEVDRKCYNSLMRHFVAKATGELIDDDLKQGTGCYHDVLIAVNALIAVERRLREEKRTDHGFVVTSVTANTFDLHAEPVEPEVRVASVCEQRCALYAECPNPRKGWAFCGEHVPLNGSSEPKE